MTAGANDKIANEELRMRSNPLIAALAQEPVAALASAVTMAGEPR